MPRKGITNVTQIKGLLTKVRKITNGRFVLYLHCSLFRSQAGSLFRKLPTIFRKLLDIVTMHIKTL